MLIPACDWITNSSPSQASRTTGLFGQRYPRGESICVQMLWAVFRVAPLYPVGHVTGGVPVDGRGIVPPILSPVSLFLPRVRASPVCVS